MRHYNNLKYSVFLFILQILMMPACTNLKNSQKVSKSSTYNYFSKIEPANLGNLKMNFMELEDCIIQKDVARFNIYVRSGDTLLVSHFTESYKINNYKISKHGFLSIMRRFENKRDSLPVSFCGGYAGRGIGVQVTLVLDSGKQYTYSYCKKYWDGLRFVVTQLKANAKVK